MLFWLEGRPHFVSGSRGSNQRGHQTSINQCKACYDARAGRDFSSDLLLSYAGAVSSSAHYLPNALRLLCPRDVEVSQNCRSRSENVGGSYHFGNARSAL